MSYKTWHKNKKYSFYDYIVLGPNPAAILGLEHFQFFFLPTHNVLL